MEANVLRKQVFGSITLLVGCASSFPLLRLLLSGDIFHIWRIDLLARNFWNLSFLLLLTAFSVYLVCTGLRMLNPALVRSFRFGWGKIIFGSLMLLSSLRSHYEGEPAGPLPILKPSNEHQALTMKATGIVLDLFFSYLIFRGIRQGFSRLENIKSPETTPSR